MQTPTPAPTPTDRIPTPNDDDLPPPRPPRPPPPPTTTETAQLAPTPPQPLNMIAESLVSILPPLPLIFPKIENHLPQLPPTATLSTSTDPSLQSFQSFMSTHASNPQVIALSRDIQRFLADVAFHVRTNPSSTPHLAARFEHFFTTKLEQGVKGIAEGLNGYEVEALRDGAVGYVHAAAYGITFGEVVGTTFARDAVVQSRCAGLGVCGFGVGSVLEVVGGEEKGRELEAALGELYRMCGLELLRMDFAVTPKSKLDCIVKCNQLIAERMPSKLVSSGADQLLPTLILIVVRTNPPRLVSNLRYIHRFTKWEGYTAYCMTNMSAVLSFIDSFDFSMLGESPHDLVEQMRLLTLEALGSVANNSTPRASATRLPRFGEESKDKDRPAEPITPQQVVESIQGFLDEGSSKLQQMLEKNGSALAGLFGQRGANQVSSDIGGGIRVATGVPGSTPVVTARLGLSSANHGGEPTIGAVNWEKSKMLGKKRESSALIVAEVPVASTSASARNSP
ncbi:hypothetical protein BJ742DRAFT_822206 [Cladochytrium replicatum]|nr:hypothetical protein BJ742DRAFT_822206 [Cladochytrium replicatum]